MTLGPARIFIPVCPWYERGGPIGYVENDQTGVCPRTAWPRGHVPFKHREPWLAEAIEAHQQATDNLKRLGPSRVINAARHH